MCWILFQQGTLVEELCHQLRYLPMLKKWAEKARLRLLCEGRGKDGSTSTVIVSVVSVTVVICFVLYVFLIIFFRHAGQAQTFYLPFF